MTTPPPCMDNEDAFLLLHCWARRSCMSYSQCKGICSGVSMVMWYFNVCRKAECFTLRKCLAGLQIEHTLHNSVLKPWGLCVIRSNISIKYPDCDMCQTDIAAHLPYFITVAYFWAALLIYQDAVFRKFRSVGVLRAPFPPSWRSDDLINSTHWEV